MIGKLNHVAIATPDLASAAARYRDVLGAEISAPEDLPEQKNLPFQKSEIVWHVNCTIHWGITLP
ncbi:MAG: VOC family protein [Sphingomonadales bacterium]